MRDIMRDGFVSFVIAHAMAHVALKHYGDDDAAYLESGYKSSSAVFPTTHPSPFVRRARLQGYIADCALPSGLKVIFEETAAAAEVATRRLTANATKAARLARRQGVSPHPIWLGGQCDYTLFHSPLAGPRPGFGD